MQVDDHSAAPVEAGRRLDETLTGQQIVGGVAVRDPDEQVVILKGS